MIDAETQRALETLKRVGIESVQALRIQPGDVIVVKLKAEVEDFVEQAVRRFIGETLPDNKIRTQYTWWGKRLNCSRQGSDNKAAIGGSRSDDSDSRTTSPEPAVRLDASHKAGC